MHLAYNYIYIGICLKYEFVVLNILNAQTINNFYSSWKAINLNLFVFVVMLFYDVRLDIPDFRIWRVHLLRKGHQREVIMWSFTLICVKREVMDSPTCFQVSSQVAYFLWSCDNVYNKQEVCFLMYFLGQIVSWQYNPNLLD